MLLHVSLRQKAPRVGTSDYLIALHCGVKEIQDSEVIDPIGKIFCPSMSPSLRKQGIASHRKGNSMSWLKFGSKPAQPAVASELAYARPTAPGIHIMAPGTTIDDYRGGYVGAIISANPGCGNCKGDGLVPGDGPNGLTVCSCRCEALEQNRVRAQVSAAKPT